MTPENAEAWTAPFSHCETVHALDTLHAGPTAGTLVHARFERSHPHMAAFGAHERHNLLNVFVCAHSWSSPMAAESG